jgi:hypothetical protein
MAREITTTGSKKVATLQKEFNTHFPYLRLKICPIEAKELVKKGESITGVDNSKTLSEVRTKKGTGQVSLTGSKSIKRLEKEFDEIFGLFVQICYTEKDGKRYYTSSDDGDGMSLTALNRDKEAKGCQKGVWE